MARTWCPGSRSRWRSCSGLADHLVGRDRGTASALRNCSTCVTSGTAPSCSNTAAAPARLISASDVLPSSPQARPMSTRVRGAGISLGQAHRAGGPGRERTEIGHPEVGGDGRELSGRGSSRAIGSRRPTHMLDSSVSRFSASRASATVGWSSESAPRQTAATKPYQRLAFSRSPRRSASRACSSAQGALLGVG